MLLCALTMFSIWGKHWKQKGKENTSQSVYAILTHHSKWVLFWEPGAKVNRPSPRETWRRAWTRHRPFGGIISWQLWLTGRSGAARKTTSKTHRMTSDNNDIRTAFSEALSYLFIAHTCTWKSFRSVSTTAPCNFLSLHICLRQPRHF